MPIPSLPARKTLVGVALVASGVVAGGAVAVVTTANASESSTSTSDRGCSGETPLTGNTLSSVEAAVLAEYPDATFDRVETDSDGAYEAHITTADGERLTVALDDSYAITGTD